MYKSMTNLIYKFLKCTVKKNLTTYCTTQIPIAISCSDPKSNFYHSTKDTVDSLEVEPVKLEFSHKKNQSKLNLVISRTNET